MNTLTHEIQFRGRFNLPQVSPNYLICMHKVHYHESDDDSDDHHLLPHMHPGIPREPSFLSNCIEPGFFLEECNRKLQNAFGVDHLSNFAVLLAYWSTKVCTWLLYPKRV